MATRLAQRLRATLEATGFAVKQALELLAPWKLCEPAGSGDPAYNDTISRNSRVPSEMQSRNNGLPVERKFIYSLSGMKLAYDTAVLHRFCRERGIAKLEMFGSALRDDFRIDSDIDLLCTMRTDAKCTLLGWADIQLKLTEIFGHPVDLVSRWAIERSQNPYRRNPILSTARPVYVEG